MLFMFTHGLITHSSCLSRWTRKSFCVEFACSPRVIWMHRKLKSQTKPGCFTFKPYSAPLEVIIVTDLWNNGKKQKWYVLMVLKNEIYSAYYHDGTGQVSDHASLTSNYGCYAISHDVTPLLLTILSLINTANANVLSAFKLPFFSACELLHLESARVFNKKKVFTKKIKLQKRGLSWHRLGHLLKLKQPSEIC